MASLVARLSAVAADLTYAWRFLRRHLGFTAVAVGTLALGLGMSTAIFSAEYAIVLRPLPFPHADDLVTVRAVSRDHPEGRAGFAASFAHEIATENVSFASVGVALPVTVTVRSAAMPELVTGEKVSDGFFDVFGIAPLLGRPIRAADTRPGAEAVVVLSHALWQRMFGGAPDVLGRVVDLAVGPSNAFMPFSTGFQPYLIAGVMPPADRFPMGADQPLASDDALWVPLVPETPRPRMAGMSPGPQLTGPAVVTARLRDGHALPQVRADLRALADRWLAANPDADRQWRLDPVALQRARVPEYATAVLLLVGAVNAVLVLACVSLGGLLAARTRARSAELAIRAALGAGRGRIAQQLLMESLLLAGLGGGLGLGVAWSYTRLLRTLAPVDMPALRALTLDGPILAYAAIVCLVGGVAIGALPALHLFVGRWPTTLRLADGLRSATARTRRARSLLVAAQVALVFPLVAGAALALRSFDRLINVDVGYRTDHVLVMNVRLSASTCASRHFDVCLGSVNRLVDRVRALPGVVEAAVAGTRPFDIAFSTAAYVDSAQAHPFHAQFSIVTPGYFRTMGVGLTAGRLFDARDDGSAPKVVVVNDTFARQYFGGRAVGHRMSVDGRPAGFEIVGVVADANDRNLRASPEPGFYEPFAQAELVARTTLLLRTSRDPAGLEAATRASVSAVDPDAPITNAATLDEIVSTQAASPRFNSALLGAFAFFGLVVALLGVYGLVAYSVTERLREFGVRRAVGASSADLWRLVVGEGVRAVGAGLAGGLDLAVLAGQWYRSQLFDISPTDPASLLGVAVLIVLVAAVAYGLPARRATQVDPVVVLRNE